MRGSHILTPEGFEALIEALAADGRRVLGPTRTGDVVDLDDIAGLDDLAAGVGDEQSPGRYRLRELAEPLLFGATITATSPRRVLHPPHEHLLRIRRADGTFVTEVPEPDRPVALVGIRPCDLAGIQVADRVAADGGDHAAVRRRAEAFVVVVNCTTAAETCFCVSMGSGPEATFGHDLAVTELHDADGHRFVVEAGSGAGDELLDRLATSPATEADVEGAARAIDRARDQQRHLDLEGLHDALLGALEHPRWDDVAERCLSCGNCTMVCPTCFCTTVEDRTDLAGQWTDRSRRWESCFSLDHSHLGEGSVRTTVRDRYRQWLTHKLATWVDQFDEVGCVGCGRCLTWCPVGIDITAEAAALREPAG